MIGGPGSGKLDESLRGTRACARRPFPPGAELGKALLLSIVFVPVLLGMWAASARRARSGLARLLAAMLAFDVLYAAFLYYVFLRIFVL